MVRIANVAKLLGAQGRAQAAVVCPDVPRRIGLALHHQGPAAHPDNVRLGASGDGLVVYGAGNTDDFGA